MDIQFSCNVCGQGITIEESGAGMAVQCPHCSQEVRVPLPPRKPKPVAPPPVPVVPMEVNAKVTTTGENIKPSANPFPVLTFVSQLLRGVGWLVFAGALICVFLSAGDLWAGDKNSKWGGLTLVIGIAAGVVALIVVAIGELVGVAFAIEANTRRLADTAAGKAAK